MRASHLKCVLPSASPTRSAGTATRARQRRQPVTGFDGAAPFDESASRPQVQRSSTRPRPTTTAHTRGCRQARRPALTDSWILRLAQDGLPPERVFLSAPHRLGHVAYRGSPGRSRCSRMGLLPQRPIFHGGVPEKRPSSARSFLDTLVPLRPRKERKPRQKRNARSNHVPEDFNRKRRQKGMKHPAATTPRVERV